MKRIFTLTVLSVFLVCFSKLNAQDIHYSQFYASPLTLNPSLTGVFQGTYRISGMYRTQWGHVDQHPYVTPCIGFEYKSLFQKLIKKGSLSAGIIVWNDKSGTGNLRFFNALVSVAYQLPLDQTGNHNLSFGVQSGFAQKGLDFNKLTFESQFTGLGFSNIPSGENLNNSYTILPFNAGISYSGKLSPKVDLLGGFAAFNINQPTDGFNKVAGTDSKIPMRMALHLGGRYGVNAKVNILPNILYMTQAGATEVNVGGLVSYMVNSELGGKPVQATVFGGLFYRVTQSDAIIPTVGVEYNNIRVGLSYDVNISSLSSATNGLGGFEISAIYIGNIFGAVLDKQILTCPRW